MSEEALRLQIQNLKKHNARLKRIAHDARTKLNAALDGTGLFLWQLDIPSGKLVIFNRRWGAMLGFQPKETDANFESWKESLHPEDADEVLQAFNDHIAGKAPYYEALHRMIAKNGSITWVLDRGRVSEWNAHGEPVKVIGTHIDMTKEKQYEEQLALLALHDPLTMLNNRHALQNYFCELKAQGPLCVVFIDLDNFKHVNDTLGHRSGDEVLIQLSHRFTELAPAEVMIGRLGGDEFVLLLPFAIDHPQVRQLANACLDAVLAPFDMANGHALIGASVGVSQVQGRDDFDTALARADEAMYCIKKNGKRGVAFAPFLPDLI
ncbi:MULTISPECIES: sensor domain-containing diguanylate cyclase [unclassified Pantoea]|uniref:sensor domain-containing diguanylate cyclase n=1 Tax=unclassified Pantoea TaxID=2630326 RepID=UPI0023DC7E6D|nr:MULTISPECIES: sensor domain-containing diguanylate cyclase [unclassified Pantoea]MDF2042403.1 sensor domain-containing diguanylate cyclase [Pantoea sp. Cr_R14]MDF2072748.1 sensor domain-containing diguanylate cyclase [Pantoea sp. Cr_R13]MDF2079391.1 sensor domain-containing diguanylate cyclase [Pantoea sp. Cr_R21]